MGFPDFTIAHTITPINLAGETGKAKSTPAWFQHLADVKVDMRYKGQPIHLEGKGIFEAMFTGGK